MSLTKLTAFFSFLFFVTFSFAQDKFVLSQTEIFEHEIEVSRTHTQLLSFRTFIQRDYASISISVGDNILVDQLDISKKGETSHRVYVVFDELGKQELKIKTSNSDVMISEFKVTSVESIDMPLFTDISKDVGLEQVPTLKYGGPTVADMDRDGYYDFVVNNHNAESSKLYWNKAGKTVEKNKKDLSLWKLMDLHGSAVADYDKDGDLDLVIAMGGGNGTNPAPPTFYQNDNGKLRVATGDVGIFEGARGRAVRWSDMDWDGDLDLMLINERGLAGETPQHLFYQNQGDGTFDLKPVKGLEDVKCDRVLLTDLDGDMLDDVVLFGESLSVWKGNGDFTYTDISNQFPSNIVSSEYITGAASFDYDNDGDMDLYLSRGFGFGISPGAPSTDYNHDTKAFDIKLNGVQGTTSFTFDADEAVHFTNYSFTARPAFRGQSYSFFYGKDKIEQKQLGSELIVRSEEVKGFPKEFKENGVYIGKVGKKRWKIAIVRESDIFWNIQFSLDEVTKVETDFTSLNRNVQDYLLENQEGYFVDVSSNSGIPIGGNNQGVTVGDFNNDGYEDLFLYRWGNLYSRKPDVLLLNKKGRFTPFTDHGAYDKNDTGHGDMGQAFDFDLDGTLDLLNGSDDMGKWYLYKGQENSNNYLHVKVGTSHMKNTSAYGALVVVETDQGTFTKQVRSAGAVYSQSKLDIVHFGLGDIQKINSVKVKWQSGERVEFNSPEVNSQVDTDALAVQEITLLEQIDIRQGVTLQLEPIIAPERSNKNLSWSSSNPDVVSVNDAGVVEAKGAVGEEAVIYVSAEEGKVVGQTTLKIIEFYPIQAKQIVLRNIPEQMIQGDTLPLTLDIFPKYADDKSLTWSSENPRVLSVDDNGQLIAYNAGSSIITVESNSNEELVKSYEVEVVGYEAPFLAFDDRNKYQHVIFKVGETMRVTTRYSAGTGNKVVFANHGGFNFKLREVTGQWDHVVDYAYPQADIVGTTDGIATCEIPLKGLTPTHELKEGHFYFLIVTFENDQGEIFTDTVYPIVIE